MVRRLKLLLSALNRANNDDRSPFSLEALLRQMRSVRPVIEKILNRLGLEPPPQSQAQESKQDYGA